MRTYNIIALAIALAVALALAAGACAEMPFRPLTGAEITREMGAGWNLGNTMDGHSGFTPSETCWQPTITNQTLVNAVHDAGFNTMRLPVTWGTMIDDADGYRINAEWLSRVQDIADYAVKQDMYVIINLHHDGAEQTGWLRIAAEGGELETVKAKFGAVWAQIAEVFRDYDEHIIFEAMNEVVGSDASPEGVLRDYRTIEALNQIFVDTVRASGGNNEKRWLLCPARYTNIVNTLNPDYGFRLPDDPLNAQNRLMLSVHDYDYSFGILANMGAVNWGREKALNLSKHMQSLKSEYVDKGIPVVLGEYGAVNKNNPDSRAYYYEAMNRMCVMCGIVPCAWDIGWYDRSQNPDYTFSLFDRLTGEKLFPEVTDAIMRGYFKPLSGNLRGNILKIERGYVTEPLTSVEFDADAITLASGESALMLVNALPSDSQDAVVYSTSDADVVSVYAGMLRAKAPGTAVIRASSVSGSAKAELTVTVERADIQIPITDIRARADEISLTPGDIEWLSPALSPENHTDTIYYISSDESVVTVNPLGKLVAVAGGEATIKMICASGLARELKVSVADAQAPSRAPIEIAIGIYYNDSAHGLYGTETGESELISGDGTYTLTFNSRAHLSSKAQTAGVTGLSGVGAIYLYDVSGAAGALASCDIQYESIVIDGRQLALIEHAPKSAIKPNGKLDTNDPINAWDGSLIEGVSVSNYTVNIPGFDNPTQITITFTLTNWQYAG